LAVIADYFPGEFAARANGALNLLQFGCAFTIQYGIGLVVGQWSSQDGHYPVAAYRAAFGLWLALQVLALLWFAVPWFRSFISDLRLSFPSLDDRGGFVRGMAEETILEPVQGSEWSSTVT
jgi:hypothetical protein